MFLQLCRYFLAHAESFKISFFIDKHLSNNCTIVMMMRKTRLMVATNSNTRLTNATQVHRVYTRITYAIKASNVLMSI